MILLGLAPFMFLSSAMYRHPQERWFILFSLILGLVAAGLFAIMPFGMKSQPAGLGQENLHQHIGMFLVMQGLHQRLLLTLHFIWWFVFTLNLAG